MNQSTAKSIEIDYRSLLRVGVAAAREGGRILQDWSSLFHVREKTCASDLVTEADLESQHAIQSLISREFPHHGFLGEEEGTCSKGDSGYRWIVDPLDGTSNYVHGFPYYAVSIGVERDGTLVAGIVYDPNRDEMYTASLGGGTWCNGRRLAVSQVATLQKSLLVASFPPGAGPQSEAIRRFLSVLPKAQTIQRTGSAALNLANLAAGRVDGFWSFSLKPWDVAAGALLVTEAGGMITTTSGSPFRIEIMDLLATNGTELHGSLSEALTLD